jgi:hypothetical protein
MNRIFLKDWPSDGLVISGFAAIAVLAAYFDEGWEPSTQAAFLVFVACIASTFFYRMGYRSQREEIDYWTNSALIQEPGLTQRLYAQRFGEVAMKARLEHALSQRQERPPMYP